MENNDRTNSNLTNLESMGEVYNQEKAQQGKYLLMMSFL